ncbi:MAG: hypothetical protein AAF587_26000 [Bacteroidota bacterium]
MKRIHLFEFEDQSWFPNVLRMAMTRLIVLVHRFFGSSEALADLLAMALKRSGQSTILDLCSGSGGPMPEVAKLLKEKHDLSDVKIVLSDLYPNTEMANRINAEGNEQLTYLTTPVNAVKVDPTQTGLRTMVCSMHHMRPNVAHDILQHAKDQQQAICIYELSDNSAPVWLWWIGIPFNIIICLLITPFVRPLTWQQLLFTYLIPIIPVAYAWDGALSNARTYTLEDLDELLSDLRSEDYVWEKGVIKGKLKHLYLMGLPTSKKAGET